MTTIYLKNLELPVLMELRTPFVTAKLIGGRIIENIIHEYAELDVKELEEIKQLNMKIVPEGPYTVLVDAAISATITSEGRKLSASKEYQRRTIAKALLIKSLSQRIVARFYLKFNKPVTPTEIFENRDKAIAWLQEQLKKHNS